MTNDQVLQPSQGIRFLKGISYFCNFYLPLDRNSFSVTFTIFVFSGLSSQMQGVVSPHELLQKLQLVQQEQSLASHDPPRLLPTLAPRFLGPTPGQGGGSVPNATAATAGQKAALQFQVSSVTSFLYLCLFFFFKLNNDQGRLTTVPLCTGHLPTADTSHCGPQPAPLTQRVHSGKVEWQLDSGWPGGLPCPLSLAHSPAAGGDQSSVQKPASSHTAETDPGKKKNLIADTDTSFPIVNLLFYSKLLILVCFRLTAHSWTPSMTPTSAALPTTPAASTDDSSHPLSVQTSCREQ